VLNRKIEPVIYDPASDPRQFRSLAERLFQVDHIRLLFGCYMSSTRKAVLPVVESHRGLLFYPTLYEGFEYSRHCIYTGAAPNQNSLQLAKFLLSTYGNRFLLVGSNYIYPYESNRLMADFVVQGRGEVLDEIYVPLEASPRDFEKVVNRIKKTSPDVIFSTVVGHGTSLFYEAYRKAGFDPSRMPIASLTTSEAEVAEMHPEAAEGHITAAPFFETSSSPSARRFVESFKGRYGPDAPVTAAAEAAYFQLHLAMRALARCGSDDPERVLKELRDSEFDAPQGRVRIDPENNHTYLWPRIARLDKLGRFQTVWNPGVRIKPDPYCVVQSLDDWSIDDLQTVNH
jgi:branched-chain amino acid transport system substrate-binding protein